MLMDEMHEVTDEGEGGEVEPRSPELDELDLKKRAIQDERTKLQAVQIFENRINRQKNRFELFYEGIKEAITTLPCPTFEPIDYDQGRDREYVLCLSDIHFGSAFKSQNNTFNRAICKQRFNYLLSELKTYIVDNAIQKIKVLNMGDVIQGMIHISDLTLNEVPVVDAVVEVSRLLAEFLNQLSSVCMVDYYPVSASNHSQVRPLGTKASEIATEDMERIIVNYISDLLASNGRVQVIHDLSKEYAAFSIFDFKAVALHGHQIKNPANVVKDLANLHRTLYDYVFLGHRHTSHEIVVAEEDQHNVEVLNCPSFVGSCPYSDKLLVGGKAAAKVYVFDPVFGHIESKTIILN